MDTRIAVALDCHKSLKPREKQAIAETTRSEEALLALRLADVRALIERESLQEWDPESLLAAAEKNLVLSKRRGIRPVLLHSQDYPRRLAEIYDPPFVLWTAGNTACLSKELLGYVGTRRPSEMGRRAAWKFGAGCHDLGIGLVSGLAFGIDAAVHSGFLSRARIAYSQGTPGCGAVAVLASGLGEITPQSNASIARGIVQLGGCLVSEYPVYDPAYKYRFIARNRIIAGLVSILVMGECPSGSGALHTLQFALDQGREVLVHRPNDKRLVNDGLAEAEAAGAKSIVFAEEIVANGSPYFSLSK